MPAANNTRFLNWLIILSGGLLIFGIVFMARDFMARKIAEPSMESPLDIEGEMLPGFIPGQNDDWGVHFFTPDGMYEDAAAAQKSGVYKVLRSVDSRTVHPESAVVISFCRKNDNRGLNQVVIDYVMHLKSKYPDCVLNVGMIRLNPKVVQKFEFMGLPHESVSFLFDDKNGRPVYSCALFFFETPAGYWTIKWKAPRAIIMRDGRERGIFISLIGYVAITIERPETKAREIYM